MIRILLLFFAMTATAGAMDLTLKDAIEIALENNRVIKIQKENVVVSEGEVTFQKGAFDPILNISSFYNDGETPTVNTFIPEEYLDEHKSFGPVVYPVWVEHNIMGQCNRFATTYTKSRCCQWSRFIPSQ